MTWMNKGISNRAPARRVPKGQRPPMAMGSQGVGAIIRPNRYANVPRRRRTPVISETDYQRSR